MQLEPTEYCNRRRGRKNGNGRPVPKGRARGERVSNPVKLLILAIFLAPFGIAYGVQNPLFTTPWVQASSHADAPDPEAVAIESFLARYGVETDRCARLAQALVASGRKQKVDSRLLASILIVESRGDPHAISSSHAIGVMQIHLPTWGSLAEDQGINLFKVEDNVDLGAKILHDYIEESGQWEGVMRYHGWASGDASSREFARNYAGLVRQLYES